MVEPKTKTKKTDASVDAFVSSIVDPSMQRDARAVLKLMKRVTGERPAMWGASIVGSTVITSDTPPDAKATRCGLDFRPARAT